MKTTRRTWTMASLLLVLCEVAAAQEFKLGDKVVMVNSWTHDGWIGTVNAVYFVNGHELLVIDGVDSGVTRDEILRFDRRAMDWFSKRLRESTTSKKKAEWHYKRSLAWMHLNEGQLALNDANEAVRFLPSNPHNFILRAKLCLAMGEYDRAIADASEAVRIDPQLAFGYADRGEAYERKGEYVRAIVDYSKALQNDSSEASVLFRRAIAYVHQKEFQKARRDLTRAVEFRPSSAEFLNEFAWLLATCPDDKVRDGNRAVQVATKAVKMTRAKVEKAAYLDTLAAASAEVGDFAKAIETTALALAESDNESRAEIEEHMKLFKAGKPVREGVQIVNTIIEQN